MGATIFTFEARDKNLGALIEANRERLRRLNAEFKKVDEGTQEYKDLAVQISATKEETRKLTDEQKKLNREFAAMDVPTDSLAGLRIEYSKLNDQIAKLSAAERNSAFGKKLISDSANVKKQIDGVEQSFGRFTGNVGNYRSAFDGLAPVVSKVGFVVGGLFAALQGGSAIVNATRETEKFFAVLKNAVGSETAAKQIFADLQDFAATTPFQLNELVNSFTKLENRNFNPTIEQLRTMGDIAASSGKSIDQFVEAILDAQTGEFERLKEFGIVARKNGDELNVTFRGQTTTLKNTSEAISDYLLGLGKLPGIQGAASAVAKTLDGSISNLEDNMTRLFATIGSGGGVLKATVDSFNFLVGAVNDFLDVPLSEEIESEKTEFNALAVAVQAAGEGTETRTLLIQKMQTEYPGFLANLDAEKVTNEQLALAIAETNLQFQKKIVLAANEERLAEAAKKVTEVVNEQTDAILRQGRVVESQEERRRARESQQETPRDPTTGRLQFRVTDKTVEEAQAQERLGNIIDDTQQKITDATNEQAKLQAQLSDTFFQLFGQTEEQARAELGLSEARKKGNKDAGDTKDQNDAVAGSIRFLNEQIDELQKKIQNTPAKSPILEGLVKDLVKVQKELEDAEKALEKLTNKAKLGDIIPETPVSQIPTLDLIPDEIKSELPEAIGVFDELKGAVDDFYDHKKDAGDKDESDEDERRKRLKDAAINASRQIADATFEIQRNRIDREQEIAIQALENEYNRKIEKAGGNAKKVAQLEKELATKREAIEKESAKKRKKIAKQEAVIQGALSVIEALPDLVLAAFAAAATVAQIAVIDSQEFAEGGFPKEQDKKKRLPMSVRRAAAQNKLIAAIAQQAPGGFAGAGIAPPDRTGRRPAGAYMKGGQVIVYHEGEYIAPASQVQRHPEVFNFLETERKQAAKPFAKGGYSTDSQPEYIAPASQVERYPHLFGMLNGEIAASGYRERFPYMEPLVKRPEFGRASISFATGGFTTVPPPAEVKSERTVKVEASLSDEQFRLLVDSLSKSVATETGKEVRTGVALGLNDNNRQQERLAALSEQRTV